MESALLRTPAAAAVRLTSRVLLLLAVLSLSSAQRIAVSVQTYAPNHHLLDIGRETWRAGVPTVVLTNGTSERRVSSPSADEVWFQAPDAPELAWNNPNENRYTAQIRFANQSLSFDWLLSGDDDTVWLVDNVAALTQTLDPDTPYYLTDSLSAGSGNYDSGVACTLPTQASELGPGGCIVSQPAAPCTRAVLEASEVCLSDKIVRTQRGGGRRALQYGGGGPGEVEHTAGIVWGFGQDGFISSAGLVNSVSAQNFSACERCDSDGFTCYGGGDVRIGECYWSFGAHGLGTGPTKPYSRKGMRAFGGDFGAIRGAAQAVVSGQACDGRCRFLLTRTLSTSTHHMGKEEYRAAMLEFYTAYRAAKLILAGSRATIVAAAASYADAAVESHMPPLPPPLQLSPPSAPPLCRDGQWTEVPPAAIANFSVLPTVACGRPDGACIMQEYLSHSDHCASRPADEDWPLLPAPPLSPGGTRVGPEVVTELMSRLRGKTVFFVGDSVTLNLWSFMRCELLRAGLNVTRVSSENRDTTMRLTERVEPPELRAQVSHFWERWFDGVGWGEGGQPSMVLDVDALVVGETGTLLVRRLMWHFVEAEAPALTSLADVLVLNFGLHYDLVSAQEVSKYTAHMGALFRTMALFANTPGKAAFFRETSRVHATAVGRHENMKQAQAAGVVCACSPSSAPPQGAPMEWSAQLNSIAATQRALAPQGERVRMLPFYAATDAMSFGHPQNWTAYLNHGTQPEACDCTHWCYSPQLVREVMASILAELPGTLLNASSAH